MHDVEDRIRGINRKAGRREGFVFLFLARLVLGSEPKNPSNLPGFL
jgi:hypothetical protein